MNLILLSPQDFISSANHVRFSDRRYQHIREILKSKTGDKLCVGLLGGRIGIGEVLSLTDKYVELNVSLTQTPPQVLPLTLILALPRPPMLRRILESVTALGVKKIYLVQTSRVEKSFWQSSVLREENLKEILMLGLEQGKDTMLPEVYLCQRFRPFVEDKMPKIIKGSLALLAHPDSPRECPRAVTGAVTLFIGPEGGFTEYEIERLKEIGFQIVSLGLRPLRVDTAVSILIGRLL